MILSGVFAKVVWGAILAGVLAWLIYEITGVIPAIREHVAKKKANKERSEHSLENAEDEEEKNQ